MYYPARQHLFVLGLILLILASCSSEKDSKGILDYLQDVPRIEGSLEYLDSPYVTAGNRVYAVGHQDGSFPPLGWHIKGEMGGVWNHPIKLLDGFRAEVRLDSTTYPLEKAERFLNFPFANQHEYTLSDLGLKIHRTQFVPDNKEGMLVEYLVSNESGERLSFDFHFFAESDLRPTWLGEENGVIDGKDIAGFKKPEGYWQFKDGINPWYVLVGSNEPFSGAKKQFAEAGSKVAKRSIVYSLDIPKGKSKVLTLAIAGSYTSAESAKKTYKELLVHKDSYLEEKKSRYAKIESQTRLHIPDSALQQCFEWLKYNSDWLVRTVPEVGTGIGAGIPDYPWWFGVDSEYALQGYMAIGQEEIVNKTIHLLDSLSTVTNGNGRIVHEVSTNGIVFNRGNINETPQFALLIAEIYRWNGDQDFLKKYFPTVEKGLEWLLAEKDKDQNGFPDGFGMMEIHGLDSEMIDVAAYTQKALEEASFMSEELGMNDKAAEYHIKAQALQKSINNQFWSEEFSSYADFIGTDKQALHLIEDALVRADTLNKPWAVEELELTKQKILANPSSQARPFVLHHNWVVNTPMEMGIADKDKALKALETTKKFVNPFGVFVTGIDRDESAGTDDGSFKGSKAFSYTGAVMTLPTGVQAIAENNYGRPDQALDYLQRMTRSFSYALPGSMYEVSPDYGMVVQAWNIYSFAVPIVRQFFGIQPMASKKEVIIAPQMPSSWKYAQLENVKIADNILDIDYKIDGEVLTLVVEQSIPEWKITVDSKKLLPGKKLILQRINGKDVEVELAEAVVYRQNLNRLEINFKIENP